MAMSDNPQTMTIDGQAHTLITSTFVDEAEALVAALVEKGIPGKLRPGRNYITRIPEFPEGTREARRKKRGALNLGILEIWMVGKIEDADRTYCPNPQTP
jgi:hypothetical protein